MTTTLIKTTGRSLTATCTGMPSVITPGFGGSGLFVPSTGLGALRGDVLRDERPMSASVAAEAAVNHGHDYAAGAGNHRAAKAQQQSEQMHTMWAYRGPGPWKEPT